MYISISSGQGQHWFAVLRTSKDHLEIFDSLGGNLQFFKKWFAISAVYEFNVTPVQCSGSQSCGCFIVFFLVLRYFNLDTELSDFLNNYFTKDCEENEAAVNKFLHEKLGWQITSNT